MWWAVTVGKMAEVGEGRHPRVAGPLPAGQESAGEVARSGCMSPLDPERLVIVVPPGTRTRTVLGWLRALFPAAMLLVASPAPFTTAPDDEVVVLDADAVDAGPLSLADAVAKSLVAK